MSIYSNLLNTMKITDFSYIDDIDAKYIPLNSIDMELYHNQKSLVLIKKYDNWLSLIESWEVDQVAILKYLKGNPNFSTKAYFFLLIENLIVNDDLNINLSSIERNDRICKKFIVSCKKDLERIPMLNKIEIKESTDKTYEEKFYKELISSIESNVGDISKDVIDSVNRYFDFEGVE